MTLGMRNLVGSQKGVVDGSHYAGDAVNWVETLVGVHLATEIRIRRDLPTA
jgi:hypothetical protein